VIVEEGDEHDDNREEQKKTGVLLLLCWGTSEISAQAVVVQGIYVSNIIRETSAYLPSSRSSQLYNTSPSLHSHSSYSIDTIV
jgi:hypothetical protein